MKINEIFVVDKIFFNNFTQIDVFFCAIGFQVFSSGEINFNYGEKNV